MTHELSAAGGESAGPVEVTVLIPTRDRTDQLNSALESILANSFRDFELLVVAQGDTEHTERLVQRYAEQDNRVRFIHDPLSGSSHARNVGMRYARGSLIVFTDDDCEVPPGWLLEFVQAFRDDHQLGVAAGAVLPGPHDPSAGFIVGYYPRRRERLRGPRAQLRDAGIGANLAFRRRAIEDAGGWDEVLGAGSGAFEGAGDFDLLYRVIGSGYALLLLPEAQLTHHGFRNWEAGARVIRGRFHGIAGAYTKHLRLGDPVAALVLMKHFSLALANVLSRAISLKRPLGLGRITALFRGFRASFTYQIDPKTKRYIRSESQPYGTPILG